MTTGATAAAPNFMGAGDQAAPAPTLKEITALANKQLKLEGQLAAMEKRMKLKKEQILKLSREDIPMALEAAGLKSFAMDSGFVVEVKDGLDASIPEAKRPAGFKWLRDHGYGGLIKNEISIAFDKGKEADAKRLKELLVGANFKTFVEAESVHASTLKSFVKERLEEGTNVPPSGPDDPFTIFQYKKTEIKKPKASKKAAAKAKK